MENVYMLFSWKDIRVGLVAFLVAAVFFVAISVWATTIGTNIDATGTLGAATSTPWGTLAVEQRADQGELKPVFVVGDSGTSSPAIFVSQKGVVSFGSSTPTATLLNLGDVAIGRNGSTNDVYISGGLGVGNATTTDGNLEVNGRTLTATLAVGTGNGNVVDRMVHGTCTVNPPSLSAGDTGHAACTDATGVTASDRVLTGVEGSAWLDDVVITAASSTAADTINFVFKNTSTTTIRDIASGVHIYYFGTQ